GRQRLGEGEGVHDATARPGGVAQQRDLQTGPSRYAAGLRSRRWYSRRRARPSSAATSSSATASPALDQVRARMSPPGPTTLACPRKRMPPLAPVWLAEARPTWASAGA